MPGIHDLAAARLATLGLPALQATIRSELSTATCLEDAAQRFVGLLRSALPSAVLVRTFATVRFRHLPVAERDHATAFARSAFERDSIADPTPVLCLLGTAGAKDAWNDRTRSRARRAIPLFSTSAIATAPMLEKMLSDFGFDLDRAHGETPAPFSIGLEALSHVSSAASERDRHGRFVISDRDFVEENGIETVFAFGGSFVGGHLLSTVVFCSSCVDATTARRLSTLGMTLKAKTLYMAAQNRIFVRKP